MKMKSLIILALTMLMFFLVGCQSTPTGPLDVIIVGNEMAENQDSAPMEVIFPNPTWEYLEVSIFCDSYGTSLEKAGCVLTTDEGTIYPDRISILNELGEMGWEMLNVNPTSEYGLSLIHI